METVSGSRRARLFLTFQQILHDHPARIVQTCTFPMNLSDAIARLKPRTVLSGLLCSFSLLAAGPSAGANPSAADRISIAPTPEWVEMRDWNLPGTTNGSSEGMHYLLYEVQEHPQREEQFSRVVVLMKNETGVQTFGTLTLPYNPEYQELLLHRIRIYRNGQEADKLDLSKVKVIQPENQLDEHMLTGRKQALLFIEDLRVGDVLEYAYTQHGKNPAFKGHFTATFFTGSSVPVERKRYRVLWSADRPLNIRRHLTDAEPEKVTREGRTEFLWDFSRCEAVHEEDLLPAGHEPYPYLELSDFPDWAAVTEWALPLYHCGNEPLPDELQALIRGWKQEDSDPAGRALKALRFVQDEIRYTGIELGEQAYLPAHPFETLRMRYGDCKGKSVLLCVILKEMGIEAYPALLNTHSRRETAGHLPAPTLFNHVIVRISLHGKTRWVDPTRSHQGGPIDQIFLPDYGKALVVKEGVSALEEIPLSTGLPELDVISVFSLKDYESPINLSVKTIAFGSEADALRFHSAQRDLKEIGKDYLNFSARFYPGISQVLPLELKDNRAENRIDTTETYSVSNLWTWNEDDAQWTVEFYGDNLNNMLPQPDTSIREMPLAIPYPLHRRQTVCINLPDADWDIPPEDNTIEHQAFSFTYSRRLSGKQLKLTYECRTKTAQIPAADVSSYLAKREEMQNALVCSLYRNKEVAATPDTNWLMVFVATVGLFFTVPGCLLAAYFFGRRKKPEPPDRTAASPWQLDADCRGLGGWLVLVGIGVCTGPLYFILGLYQMSSVFSLQAWHALTLPGSESYHALFAPALIVELIVNIWSLGFSILLIHHYFAKKRAFPAFYVFFRLSNLAFVVIDSMVTARIPSLAEDAYSEVFKVLISSIIWSLYVLRSKRVKNTFTR